MGEKTRVSRPMIGGNSLLVIFAVLCLTIFALLSLSTVQADGPLADASARAVIGYYQADRQAEELLARLRSGELPDGVTQEGEIYTYACPISDTLELRVEVLVPLDGGEHTVLRWQAASAAQWEGEETLDLWDGTLF